MQGRDEILSLNVALRRARAGDGESLRDHAITAGERFWRAMLYQDAWPAALKQTAGLIVCNLFAHGPIRNTVSAMNEAAVQSLLDDLEWFVEQFILQSTPSEAPEPVIEGRDAIEPL